MIQITCANCKNGLEVDDAFAGGVCRCQYCGTIQTVPKPGGRPRAPGAAVAQTAGVNNDEPKALYQVKSRTGLSSAPSGLEELAEVVHSSGLSGSGLLNRSRTMPYAAPAQAKQPSKTMIYAISGGIALVVLLVLFFVVGRTSDETGSPVAGGSGATGGVPTSPQFAGIDLTSDRVIYVVDRGDATTAYFNDLKSVICNSVRSLGPDRRFAVMLWNNGTDAFYPRTATAYATGEEAKQLRNWFDEVSTGRSTSIESAMTAALAQDPQEIVLITAKSDQLEGFGFESEVLKLKGSKNVKIHGVTLGASPTQDPLKKIALETKGKFVHLSRSDLSSLAD